MKRWTALVAGALVAGCAAKRSSQPNDGVDARALNAVAATTTPANDSEAEAVKSPFLFREGALPQGYPQPGVVGEIVVKTYPSHRVAISRGATQPAASGGRRDDDLFMKLFRHIKSNDIKMTAPVVMDYASDAPAAAEEHEPEPTTMSFVYGDPSDGRVGVAGDVEVVDQPGAEVVSVGVRGRYGGKKFAAAVEQLRAWLAEHASDYTAAGPPRQLAYNSPMVPPFLRYSEVQIPVARSRGEPRR